MNITAPDGTVKEVKRGGGVKCRILGQKFSIDAEVLNIDEATKVVTVIASGQEQRLTAEGIIDVIDPATFALNNALSAG